MKNVCLQLVAFLFATCTMVIVVSTVEFDQRQPSLYGDEYYNYGGHTAAAVDSENEEESQRTHHVKHKLKKLKKRLLLQCLLGHSRQRRDTSAASGRFLLPIVLQSTNVNVGSDGQQHQQQTHHGGGCMQMFGDDSHGPLQGSLPSLGSLGSPLGSLGSALGSLGSFGPSVTENPEEDESGNRNGLYSPNWNRYARQFRRNFVRPLYRLF
ncbi:uncharacterized protein LOC113560579 isoform X1 [Rhopalosiphum maidis]|uniref:uncharacterized protein LOC113560579 isoform X1 n=2 Tax=Rhopalosiphum maidis TaxID=43146 RepID=UPI000EFDB78A|nr:uncharacterized protein LOC113560579 isoform X1 [Rhopalosiphum maidis]XP_026822345.1 uncharacterized protein LOC113560579 isoform X1 [Rhopalosiphum maidis]